MAELTVRTRALVLASAICVLASCAHAPDATINYYLTKTEIDVRVVRSVSCDERSNVYYADVAVVTPQHGADLDHPQHIQMQALDGSLATSSINVQYYDDGRLKGLNTETSGQAAQVITSAIKVGTTLSLLSEGDDDRSHLCALANARTGKAVSFTYDASIDPEAEARPIEMRGRFSGVLNSGQTGPMTWVTNIIGRLYVHYERRGLPTPRVQWHEGERGFVALQLRQPDVVQVVITDNGTAHWSGSGEQRTWDSAAAQPVWQGSVLAAIASRPSYALPLPRAALFGARKFALGLSDAGEITQFGFTNGSGAADIAGIGAPLAEALRAPTQAEQVAAIRTEADLIAQTQRLARCQANAEDCK